jgi:hypothetical protein
LLKLLQKGKSMQNQNKLLTKLGLVAVAATLSLGLVTSAQAAKKALLVPVYQVKCLISMKLNFSV